MFDRAQNASHHDGNTLQRAAQALTAEGVQVSTKLVAVEEGKQVEGLTGGKRVKNL